MGYPTGYPTWDGMGPWDGMGKSGPNPISLERYGTGIRWDFLVGWDFRGTY